MPEIVTTITITLTHSRQIGSEGFKNLLGNLVEHIAEERDAERQNPDLMNPWGFADIAGVEVEAAHHRGEGEALTSRVAIKKTLLTEPTPAA